MMADNETVRAAEQLARQRIAFDIAWDRLYSVICAFSIGDIDAEYRKEAIDALREAQTMIHRGCADREAERRVDEEARIIKAYREGRLVEK